MAKILRLKELEARKRALVAESEVYRQTLTLEIQNLRIYRVRMQKKLVVARLANPLFLFGASFLGSRFFGRSARRRPRGKLSRVVGATLMGWKLFRQFGPAIQKRLVQLLVRRQGSERVNPEERSPAGNI